MRKLRICTSVTLLGNGVKVLSNSCLPEAKAFSTHLRVLPVLHDHLLGLPGLRALRIFSKSWNQLCIVSSPYPDTNASFELLLLLIIMITVIIITEGKRMFMNFVLLKIMFMNFVLFTRMTGEFWGAGPWQWCMWLRWLHLGFSSWLLWGTVIWASWHGMSHNVRELFMCLKIALNVSFIYCVPQK